jgi:hypothetical protein
VEKLAEVRAHIDKGLNAPIGTVKLLVKRLSAVINECASSADTMFFTADESISQLDGS